MVASAQTDVSAVTFTRSPDHLLETWRTPAGPNGAAHLGFVAVDEEVRSSATAVGPAVAGTTTVASVSSPVDLTGLGIRVGGFMEDWEADGHRLVLCTHSLTTYLQDAGFRTVYAFLHVLAGRVRDLVGVAHSHLGPSAHDPGIVNAFLGLVDKAVEPREGARWVVTRRL